MSAGCSAGRVRAPSDPGASARRPRLRSTARREPARRPIAQIARSRRLRLNERVDRDDRRDARRVELGEHALRDVDVRRDRKSRDHRPSALLERRDDELPFPPCVRRSRRSIAHARESGSAIAALAVAARRRDDRPDRRPVSRRSRRSSATCTLSIDARRRRAATTFAPSGAATSMRTPPRGSGSASAANASAGGEPLQRHDVAAVAQRREPVDDPTARRRRREHRHAARRCRARASTPQPRRDLVADARSTDAPARRNDAAAEQPAEQRERADAAADLEAATR